MPIAPGQGWVPDAQFIRRLKRSYRAAVEGYKISRWSVWAAISKRQQPIHLALLADSDEPLCNILGDPASTDLFYGVDNLFREACTGDVAREDASISAQHDLASMIREVAGSESTDVSRLDIPLASRVVFPNPFRGEFGFQTPRGIASYRAIHAVYQAWRVEQALNWDKSKRIIEVGPGMGRTCFYLYAAGFHDYTTVDLPMGIVAQACFLGATLGPDAIWMIGDEGVAAGKIRLLPAGKLSAIKETFDVAINVDSIVEMEPWTALRTGRWIGQHATQFFSINHEWRRLKTRHISTLAFPRHRRQRMPCPIRPGYFEEHFVFSR